MSNTVDPLSKYAVGESAIRTSFNTSCSKVWTEHIIHELIHSEGLLLCLVCLGFCYDIQEYSHPIKNVIRVGPYLVKENLGTEQAFKDHFWQLSVKKQAQYGRILIPQLNYHHVEPPTVFDASEPDEFMRKTMSRISALEDQAREQDETHRKYSDRVAELEKQVADLLEQLVQERVKQERVKFSAKGHLDELYSLLHQNGCDCCQGDHSAILKRP